MKCERAIRKLLLLDHGEQPDRLTVRHLDRCTRCRCEYERFCLVMGELNPDAPDPGTGASAGALPTGTGDLIMASVRERADAAVRKQPAQSAPVDYRTWVAIGVLIVAGLVTLPWNATLSYLYLLPGSTILVATGVAMGAVVTIYFCIFVATHLEELSSLVREDSSTD